MHHCGGVDEGEIASVKAKFLIIAIDEARHMRLSLGDIF
jgi:hypothetical protein